MAKVICFANQKGGVGKTTSCVNLAAAIRAKNRTSLVVDADPQGNAASGLGVSKRLPGVYDAMAGRELAETLVQKTPYTDVLPAGPGLAGASVELATEGNRNTLLRGALAPLREKYDYILIDSPPSLGLITLNVLAAADSVIVPVQCEYYALEGLADLMKTIKLTARKINPDIYLEGVLLTMYDRRLSFSEQVARDVRGHFGREVFETVVPRNVRLAEAPSHGKPIQAYAWLSKGAEAYDRLAVELFAREKRGGKR